MVEDTRTPGDAPVPAQGPAGPAGRPTHTVPARDADPARHLTPPTRRTPETDDMKEIAARRQATGTGIWQGPLVRAAALQSLVKLDPRLVARNPVMFVVEVGALVTTVALIQQLATGSGDRGFTLQIALWLWFTVAFTNFAEAMAEARGKAQADTLRATRRDTPARRLVGGREETVSSTALRKGDLVLVREGEIVPGDGEVIEGVAYVNEAAITGESAPVLKEPGTDRSEEH